MNLARLVWGGQLRDPIMSIIDTESVLYKKRFDDIVKSSAISHSADGTYHRVYMSLIKDINGQLKKEEEISCRNPDL